MPKSVFQDIYRELKLKIENGSYPYQSFLPSEAELTDEYACSRSSIRRALGMLARDGYVQSQQGKGVRVIRNPQLLDHTGYNGLETFNELAARCGLSVVEGGLMGSAGYLEARFDRTPEGAPVFVQSAATLVRRKRRSRAQPMAAAAGYLDAADILNREGADAAGDLKELFGRLLFNALIGNNRDRLDQIWLTPTSSGVKLLPMYAPTATPTPATGGRQLSTPIRGTGTIVAPEAVVANARYFGLSSARAKMLCLEFTQIVSGWREVAQAVGADFFTVSQMARLFEQ